MDNMEIKKLEELIIKHRFLYYMGTPEISDAEYDALENRLKKLDPTNMLFKQIGFEVSKSDFKKVKFKQKMPSLGKVYSEDETLKWFKDNYNGKYIVSHKIDGFAISLTYAYNSVIGKYILKQGCSRGNGEEGEDITENIKQIKDIPFTLSYPESASKILEVRGEIYMKKSVLNDLINEGLLPKTTAIRNIAPGSARNHDVLITKERKLSFYAYDCIEEFDTFENTLTCLTKLGFNVVPHYIANDKIEIVKYYNKIIQDRESLDYCIDGVVIRVDKNKYYKELGNTSHHPRGAVAWKPDAESAISVLTNIEWQVSRTGLINPVAIYEPVEIEGVTVERATLHNLDYIKDLNINIGSTVVIERAGGVIPKIIKKVTDSDNITPILIPNKCPICDNDTIIKTSDGGVRTLHCSNNNCDAVLVSQLVHFCTVMEFKGISEQTIIKLYKHNLLKSFVDFFTLNEKKDAILSIEGFQNRSVNKLLDTISNNKVKTFNIFLQALGIKHLGENVSKLIEKRFTKEDVLNGISLDMLLTIDGIGEEIAKEFVNGISNMKFIIIDMD
jgi:DNA ligase (NAD+)